MAASVSINCRRRDNCRLCASRRLELVLSLTPTPPANAFVRDAQDQEAFPLDLFFCLDCRHLQLLDIVDPVFLFKNYVYVSGTSPVFVKHFQEYADDLVRRFEPATGDLIVDVGSNDGTLLGFFKKSGLRVLGVDPAKDTARRASEAGIETIPEFFTPALAKSIRDKYGAAFALTANNVFAHADDLEGMVAGVRELISPDGIFAFEVSYLLDVHTKTLFDTIYHEHLAYHSVKPLRSFLQANGMQMIEALRVDSHGGSLRCLAQCAGGPRRAGSSVEELIRLEESLGLDRPETFARFTADIEKRKTELSALLSDFKGKGMRIAGFGAPAKATTLMYHFGLGPALIDFIVDDSPWKQGLLSPGLHIPILSSSAIYERRPDCLVIMAWNFADSIRAKHKAYAESGGRFIVPLPNPVVYD
ncbi:MAG: class I SAM-dependent methyltransferase [Elusimicrobiota bacterium]